jgi:pilus assembly protein CpaB
MVVLASTDLDVGREIRTADFYSMNVPQKEMLRLTQGKLVFGKAKELVGRVVRTKVKSGTPFFLDSVYPDGTGPTPADLLTDGMRAVTVRMGLVGGVRGFVSPESWVDVLFRRAGSSVVPGSTQEARTHTLLPGIRVLGIQDSLYPETVLRKDARGNMAEQFEVTLELTPAQCEVLKSVEQRGELSLNLLPKQDGMRNPGLLPDPELMKILLGVEIPEPPVVVVPPPSVKVIRGGSPSSVPVANVVDTIIDSNLYPAPAAADVPLPGRSGPAEEVWPAERIEPPADENNPEDTQSQLEKLPGADKSTPAGSRPARSTDLSTLVYSGSSDADQSDASGFRMPSTTNVPQTRRVFSKSPEARQFSEPAQARRQPVPSGTPGVRYFAAGPAGRSPERGAGIPTGVPMPVSRGSRPVAIRSLAGGSRGGLYVLSAGRYSGAAGLPSMAAGRGKSLSLRPRGGQSAFSARSVASAGLASVSHAGSQRLPDLKVGRR